MVERLKIQRSQAPATLAEFGGLDPKKRLRKVYCNDGSRTGPLERLWRADRRVSSTGPSGWPGCRSCAPVSEGSIIGGLHVGPNPLQFRNLLGKRTAFRRLVVVAGTTVVPVTVTSSTGRSTCGNGRGSRRTCHPPNPES